MEELNSVIVFLDILLGDSSAAIIIKGFLDDSVEAVRYV